MDIINPFTEHPLRIGILGGGQLGKMYCEAASNWNWEIWILDKQRDFPAGPVATHFVEGDFTNYDDVYAFGMQVDLLTIEIEKVNVEALDRLESEGLTVHPSPRALRIIRDKGRQKAFYEEHDLPTAEFSIVQDAHELEEQIRAGEVSFPFVQKARTGGYDGRGVAVIRDGQDMGKLLDTPSVIEPLVDIAVEISVIAVRSASGEIRTFPPVGMEFHPEANLVEYLYSPSGIDPGLEQEAIRIAEAAIRAYDICGLLAVEMFVTRDGRILINEVAPRPHNSGHHTIESCSISQFQMGLLSICNLPLPEVSENIPAVMVNILGAEGYTGEARYEGVMQALGAGNVFLHLYGKHTTKPFRKMGHATILDRDLSKAIEKATFVRDTINVIT